MTANNHYIIAAVQFDFASDTTITAGSIEIRNSADTVIAENEFELHGTSTVPTDGLSIAIIGEATGGAANAIYKVMVDTPADLNAEAKILVLKAANGGDMPYTDSGSTGITTTETQLGSISTSFPSSSSIAVIGSIQADDTDSVQENLVVTTGYEIREGSTTRSILAHSVEEFDVSGTTGEGLRLTALWQTDNLSSASPTIDVRADASATGLNGEVKLLAIQIAAPAERSGTDTPVISDSATKVASYIRTSTSTPVIADSATRIASYIRAATDTPAISDSATRTGSYIRSGTDTPVITDSALVVRTRNAIDTPAITDSATRTGSYIRTRTDEPVITDSGIPSHSKTDTPAISDSATRTGNYIRSVTDTPAISDSAQATQGQFFTDTPAISDSTTRIKNSIRLATDTPAISDSATKLANYIRIVTDTPAISDSANVQESRSAIDVMAISDSAQVVQGAFSPGGKYIWFICAPAVNSTQGCVVAEMCPVNYYMAGIQNGRIVCLPLP